jgi:hypothetical protein
VTSDGAVVSSYASVIDDRDALISPDRAVRAAAGSIFSSVRAVTLADDRDIDAVDRDST